jgi:hypothetical protein
MITPVDVEKLLSREYQRRNSIAAYQRGENTELAMSAAPPKNKGYPEFFRRL